MKDLQEYLDYMKSEEGQKEIEEFVDKWINEEDEITAYFESPDFNQLFDRLINYLQQGNSVVDDNYSGIAFDNITNEQFYKLANSIFHNKDSFKGYTEYGFPHEYVVYKGVKFETIHGQGSFTVANLWNPDEFNYQI